MINVARISSAMCVQLSLTTNIPPGVSGLATTPKLDAEDDRRLRVKKSKLERLTRVGVEVGDVDEDGDADEDEPGG